MYKSIVLHERRSDFTHAQFMEHWISVHTPMSNGTENLYGYVCHEVLDDVTPANVERLQVDAAVDGIAQMWFRTPDGLLTLPEQPSVKKWFSDGPNFIGRRVRYMAEEHIVQEPVRTDGPMPKLVAFIGGAERTGERATDDVAATVKAATGSLHGARGVSVSTILSNHPTASIGGFPMGRVDCVLELLGESPLTIRQLLSAFIQQLRASGSRSELLRVRAFATAEFVIRTPAS